MNIKNDLKKNSRQHLLINGEAKTSYFGLDRREQTRRLFMGRDSQVIDYYKNNHFTSLNNKINEKSKHSNTWITLYAGKTDLNFSNLLTFYVFIEESHESEWIKVNGVLEISYILFLFNISTLETGGW